MRLVALRNLTADAQLACDVSTGRPGEAPLARAGVVLDEGWRQRLLRAGFHAVYVEDDLGEGIVIRRPLNEETRMQALATMERTLTEARGAMGSSRPLPAPAIRDLEQTISLITTELDGASVSSLALADLAMADAYTLQHSLDVAVVGLLLAQRANAGVGRTAAPRVRAQLMLRIGIGLMVHDVGKLVIPQEVLAKDGPLDEHEWDLVRRHPRAGVDMLSGSGLGTLTDGIVRWHHERWDGRGYPDGIAGQRIPIYARIAAVADTFDAITSSRVYQRARPQHAAVRIIAECAGSQFDPTVAAIFCRHFPAYPPGSELELTDGRRGVVVSVPQHAATPPRVRIGFNEAGERIVPYELDLAAHAGLAPPVFASVAALLEDPAPAAAAVPAAA